jgi:hypothetical protein
MRKIADFQLPIVEGMSGFPNSAIDKQRSEIGNWQSAINNDFNKGYKKNA